jgi:hypothetical protein
MLSIIGKCSPVFWRSGPDRSRRSHSLQFEIKPSRGSDVFARSLNQRLGLPPELPLARAPTFV